MLMVGNMDYKILTPLHKPEPGHAWQTGEIVSEKTLLEVGADIQALIKYHVICEVENNGEIQIEFE